MTKVKTDEPSTLEQLRVALKEVQARQDVADAAREAALDLRNPLPGAPGKRSHFSSELAYRQEVNRVARVRAAEEQHLRELEQELRDRPKYEARDRKLAPLSAREQEIYAEQQRLELELFDIGRKRSAVLAEWQPAPPAASIPRGVR